MKLEVKLFAALAERAGAAQVVLDGLPDGLTVAELKVELTRRRPELGSLTHVAGVVGTAYAPDDTLLSPGDEVALLPPVSGGSGLDRDPGLDYRRGVFRLSAEPLDIAALGAEVAHPTCGALITFTGMTRETNRGQRVTQLDYEAFNAMAGPEMERIFADCLALHGPELRMLCAHRTGTVGVGAPSVVIAVASPHRDAAFAAARHLIDTLKERLPVWKKEVYSDGHHWIGDRS